MLSLGLQYIISVNHYRVLPNSLWDDWKKDDDPEE